MKFVHSSHSVQRMSQRALSEEFISFVLRHGTPVGDGVMLTDADYARVLAALPRMRNLYVVLNGPTVVTSYRATERKQRGLMRRTPQRDRRTDRR